MIFIAGPNLAQRKESLRGDMAADICMVTGVVP